MQKYHEEINYCGPAGKFSLPRRYFGVDINHACYLHDMEYRYGDDRPLADIQFREDVYELFIRRGKSKFLAYLVSRLAYYAAKACGKMSKYR